MLTAGKFEKYIPENEKLLSDAEIVKDITGMDVIFLCDNKGRDWYEIQSDYKKDTMKIVYGDDGVINSFSADASTLNPVDSFVSEIPFTEFPSAVDVFGNWRFDGAKVVQIEVDYLKQNATLKQQLLTEASKVISILQDAVDLSMATEQETANLLNWKKYRILLNRVDPEEPEWPSKPTR